MRLLSGFPMQFSRGGYYLLTDFDLDHQILSVLKSDENDNAFAARSYARIRTEPVRPSRVCRHRVWSSVSMTGCSG